MAKVYYLGSLAVQLLLLITGSPTIETTQNLFEGIFPGSSNVSTILNAPSGILRNLIPGENGESEICYSRLGCFSMADPWTSLIRPLPTPWSPKKISPNLALYTRTSHEPFRIPLESLEWSLEGSDFNPNRSVTVVITHGFASNGNENWLKEMVTAYLKNKDANAFILDWENGATITNYLQVASNTRIVGAIMARFVRYLIGMGLKTENIHLIGHSLGSHIMSYCAKNISEISKVKRITALDPAQPAFEGTPEKVRLAPSDAEQVDVMHTDAKPFIPFFGFGMLSPVGTIDFYFNGGSSQPGCLKIAEPNITSITDLLKYPVEVIAEWIGCSHGRSYEYFTAAMNKENCTFYGRKMEPTETFLKVTTLGTLKLADPVIKELTSCTKDTCNLVGLDTFEYPARGSFAVMTTGGPPYCKVKGCESNILKDLLAPGFHNYFTNKFNFIAKKLKFF